MVTTQAENMVDEYAQRMQSQGISMQMYLQYTGMTEQQLLDQMKPQAINRIQSRLVLEAIAQAENLTVTDEDVDKECASMGEAYGMEAAKVKELLGEDGLTQMKEDLAVQKAADFIVEESVEVEAAAEE
jgi:trigger factor